MKRFLFAGVAAIATLSAPALAADIGVSITAGEPGFYGRIDVGDFAPPRLIYRRPVVIERVVVVRQPIYLHVRPGHEKNWRKHCREYDACGQPVYFVRDSWYNDVYVAHYRDHGNDRSEHHDDRRDNDHGRDHDRGNKND